jgi:hypothetical protein
MKVGLRVFILVSAILGLVTASQVNALTIGDANKLGSVIAGIPAGDSDVTDYVNAMIGLSLGGSTIVTKSGHDNTVTRSMNSFSPLDTAVLGPRVTYGNIESSTVTIHLGASGYEYLLAKYDGPNYGTEVWYINGLSGDITIPSHGGQYGISGSTLFTPGTPTGVPDGGSTVALLGLAALGLVAVSRRLPKTCVQEGSVRNGA